MPAQWIWLILLDFVVVAHCGWNPLRSSIGFLEGSRLISLQAT